MTENQVFMQECHDCGTDFPVRYLPNGSYDYAGETCECEGAAFSPHESAPSLSEWQEMRAQNKSLAQWQAERQAR